MGLTMCGGRSDKKFQLDIYRNLDFIAKIIFQPPKTTPSIWPILIKKIGKRHKKELGKISVPYFKLVNVDFAHR